MNFNLNRNLKVSLDRFLLALLLVIFILPVSRVSADIGPKPGFTMKIVYNIKPEPTLKSAELLLCEDAACKIAKPLEKLGPQNFTCTQTECKSIAYGYREYMKVVIAFSDKTRESNVFKEGSGRSTTYKLTVEADSLKVEQTGGGLPVCNSAGWLATLVVETMLAALYLGLFHLPRSLVGWVPLASLLTLPFVWFVFPVLNLPGYASTGLSEGFAFAVEAGFLWLVGRGTLPVRHAILLSGVVNLVSFLIGLSF
ncbi:MAG TPA: hypothetical protein VIO61_17400 [Anaerolineaceae bacterium]